MKLEHLDLSNNNLVGPFPALGGLLALQYLNLSHTSLYGTRDCGAV